MLQMTFKVGEMLEFSWRQDRPVVVNERMFSAAVLARAALIAVAHTGQTITYGGLSKAIDGLYHYQQLGRLLDVVSYDCFRRGEKRSLAALVVLSTSTEPSYGFVHDDSVQMADYQRLVQLDWQ
ncbi:hypothetical protein [Nocardia sp. CA-120079]|uniref:hypothetical protein n=1 Tax=Nocardia sp. CA-120079 TaxID=3239974 RepID=UPI003D96E8E2